MEQVVLSNEQVGALNVSTDGVIDSKDAKGKAIKIAKLSDGTVAIIHTGKGEDVERATMEAAGNQSKYMSSMMASTVLIDGKPVSMFDLAELSMKDYMKIQLAFAELNF